jgi:hypothetical protein
MGVFVSAVVLLLVLPQPWAALAHACMALWLLAFFAPTTFRPARGAGRSGD